VALPGTRRPISSRFVCSAATDVERGVRAGMGALGYPGGGTYERAGRYIAWRRGVARVGAFALRPLREEIGRGVLQTMSGWRTRSESVEGERGQVHGG
jgi:hypothetical protein